MARDNSREIEMTRIHCRAVLQRLSRPYQESPHVSLENIYRLFEMFRHDAWNDGAEGLECEIRQAMRDAFAEGVGEERTVEDFCVQSREVMRRAFSTYEHPDDAANLILRRFLIRLDRNLRQTKKPLAA